MGLIFGKISVVSACRCVTQLQNMDILKGASCDGICDMCRPLQCRKGKG